MSVILRLPKLAVSTAITQSQARSFAEPKRMPRHRYLVALILQIHHYHVAHISSLKANPRVVIPGFRHLSYAAVYAFCASRCNALLANPSEY